MLITDGWHHPCYSNSLVQARPPECIHLCRWGFHQQNPSWPRHSDRKATSPARRRRRPAGWSKLKKINNWSLLMLAVSRRHCRHKQFEEADMRNWKFVWSRCKLLELIAAWHECQSDDKLVTSHCQPVGLSNNLQVPERWFLRFLVAETDLIVVLKSATNKATEFKIRGFDMAWSWFPMILGHFGTWVFQLSTQPSFMAACKNKYNRSMSCCSMFRTGWRNWKELLHHLMGPHCKSIWAVPSSAVLLYTDISYMRSCVHVHQNGTTNACSVMKYP